MKKKVIYILLIIVLLIIGGLLVYKKFAKKDNPMKPEVALTGELTPNIIKLTNRYYQDNFLISPYSIKVALNMLKEGADGNTLAEIEQLLDKSTIGNVNNPNIKIANAVFISNEVKDVVEKSFVNAIRKKYNGEVLYDDFKTPEVINNWVNEHTDKMIPKILDSMDPNFIAGIANAVAIDVKWAYEFECHSTMSAPFTQRDNTIIDVEMMHNSYEREDVKYIDNDKITGIVLPYASDTNLEFIGFLPKSDVNSFINSLTIDELVNIDKEAISAGEDLHINLSMPRLKYDFDLDQFKNILIELGMKDAFNGINANFLKIINMENRIKKGRGNIYVDEAIHKTAIDLNENGTKAAAVTYFGLKDATAAAPKTFKTVNINLNKTFVYMIREKTTKEILFFGVANTPNEWNGTTCSS